MELNHILRREPFQSLARCHPTYIEHTPSRLPLTSRGLHGRCRPRRSSRTAGLSESPLQDGTRSGYNEGCLACSCVALSSSSQLGRLAPSSLSRLQGREEAQSCSWRTNGRASIPGAPTILLMIDCSAFAHITVPHINIIKKQISYSSSQALIKVMVATPNTKGHICKYIYIFANSTGCSDFLIPRNFHHPNCFK